MLKLLVQFKTSGMSQSLGIKIEALPLKGVKEKQINNTLLYNYWTHD